MQKSVLARVFGRLGSVCYDNFWLILIGDVMIYLMGMIHLFAAGVSTLGFAEALRIFKKYWLDHSYDIGTALYNDIYPQMTFNIYFYVIMAFLVLISVGLYLGKWYVSLRLYRNQPASFKDYFSQFHKVVSGCALYGILIFAEVLGFICFIVPAIYIQCKYGFAPQIFADENVGILEAFNKSAEVTRGKKEYVFGYGLILMIVNKFLKYDVNIFSTMYKAAIYEELRKEQSSMN